MGANYCPLPSECLWGLTGRAFKFCSFKNHKSTTHDPSLLAITVIPWLWCYKSELFFNIEGAVFVVALSPHRTMAWTWAQVTGSIQVCIFSPCLHEFFLGPLVSSHLPKHANRWVECTKSPIVWKTVCVCTVFPAPWPKITNEWMNLISYLIRHAFRHSEIC